VPDFKGKDHAEVADTWHALVKEFGTRCWVVQQALQLQTQNAGRWPAKVNGGGRIGGWIAEIRFEVKSAHPPPVQAVKGH